jgi:hypothetical protein
MLAPLIGIALDAAARGGARPLLAIAGAAAASAFVCVALGFATKAGFDALCSRMDAIDAALVVAAIYAGLAVLVWPATLLAQRRIARRDPPDAIPEDDIDALLPLLERGGTESAALAQVLKTGRNLPPFPMIALAVAGGLVAGRGVSK